MRKRILLWTLIVLLTALPLIGCGQDRATAAPRPGVSWQNTVDKVLEEGMATEQPTAEPTAVPAAAPGTPAPTAQITEPSAEATQASAAHARVDIDRAAMSSTMVYSEIYAMMERPQDYVGKTMRMHGIFACSQGNLYYFCVVEDATACCAQGIEFILAGNPAYPDGYPEPGTEVTVTGVFEDYREGENTYYRLRDAALEG